MSTLSRLTFDNQSITILGSNGKLGRAIKQHYVSKLNAFECHTEIKLIDGDNIEAFQKLMSFIGDSEVIINCIGLIGVEKCEENSGLAHLLNTKLPERLSSHVLLRDSRLVHISTPSVFSGLNTPYIESDPVSPTSLYGLTKSEGERMITTSNSNSVILRINFLGIFESEESIASKFIDAALEKRPIKAFTDSFFSPTYLGDLPDLIQSIIDSGEVGIIHLNSLTRVSKYEFAKKIFAIIGSDDRLIEPASISELGLLYSQDTSLYTSKEFSGMLPISLERTIERLVEDFIKLKSFRD